MTKENYASFFARLKDLPEDDIFDIDLAYAIAKHSHRHQRRKERDIQGNPVRYFEHVRRAAIVLMDEAKCLDVDAIVIALLHDSIEDTRLVTYPKLKHWFSRDVAKSVWLLTKTPDNADGYVERLIQSNDWRALLVKVCDRLDNLRSLAPTPIEFQKKQIIETRDKYIELVNKMVEVVPHPGTQNALYLRSLIIDIINQYK